MISCRRNNQRAGHASILYALAYSIFLVYGTLYPMSGWRAPSDSLVGLFAKSLGVHASRADLLTNLLVYVPFGMLLALRLRQGRRWVGVVLLCLLSGTMLSVALEVLQAYIPGRTPSVLDIILNSLGSLAGALLVSILSPQTSLGARFWHWRGRWFQTGPASNIGLAALGIWVLSQLSPFVPSIDIGNLRYGLSPLWRTLRDPQTLDVARTCVYALYLLGLGLIVCTLARDGRARAWWGYLLFVMLVLALKVPVVTRQLSLEAVLGAACALLALRAGLLLRRAPSPWLAAAAIVAGYTVDALSPGATSIGPRALSWSLFEAQMLSIHGFEDILATAWPFVALAYVCMLSIPASAAKIMAAGGVLVAGLCFSLEWAQQYVPGRVSEITDVFVAVLAWYLAWWVYRRQLARHTADITTRESITVSAGKPVGPAGKHRGE